MKIKTVNCNNMGRKWLSLWRNLIGAIFSINLIINCVLLSSCANFKDKAIIASNTMINDIIYNNENIVNYYYEPVENLYYTFLDYYDENGIWTQYGSNNFFEEYINIKNGFGELKYFEIISITYKHDMFPFYDYGYSYSVTINLKCYYENINTEENIYGYYIKEIDEVKIVSYSIKIERVIDGK